MFTRPALTHLLRRLAVLLPGAFVLASCYLPVRFDSEIIIDRAGYYDFKFDGYMAEVTLYDDLIKGEITPAEEKEKVAIIERDFLRDPSTKEFEYYRDGHFRVRWERAGDLLKVKTMTFLRSNELILQLKYVANSGYIVLEGKALTAENRQRLRAMGLNMQGQIRIKTDLPVKDSNASETQKDPKDPRFKWLVWNIESIMSPRPRAIFIIE